MQYKELCKKLLDVKIVDIHYIVPGKSIGNYIDAKGIRLDVYVKDEKDTVYDLEMQICYRGDLPKRSRYYQSSIDMDLIQSGQGYRKLNKSYVVFTEKTSDRLFCGLNHVTSMYLCTSVYF